MVLARVANDFTNGDSTKHLGDNHRGHVAITAPADVGLPMADTVGGALEAEVDDEAARPPYLHVRMPRSDDMDRQLTIGRQC
jgi:hypothetical protein